MRDSLMKGLQVILQSENDRGLVKCEAFTGVPVVNPVYIALATDGTPQAMACAQGLRRELKFTVMQMSSNVREESPPCMGLIGSFLDCHAHGVPLCKKLLVIIGDGHTKLNSSSIGTEWPIHDPNYYLLTIFPSGTSDLANLLPPKLQKINSCFWSKSICETVPNILSITGLTADDFRVFISYRRKEASDLAEQLFDSLSHENFDVFLDRFRVPPSVDFQQRLTQELAGKSMVLFLESPGILSSKWTNFEIAFAKLYRLGVVAIQPPSGTSIPGIYNTQRKKISTKDLTNTGGKTVMKDDVLHETVQFIKKEHGRALVWRRRLMRENMSGALLLAGVLRQKDASNGLLIAESQNRPKRKSYSIWMTPRPPELKDFHITETSSMRTSKGVVIGPSFFLESTRKSRLEWLSDKSEVALFDEGNLLYAAKQIAGGKV